MQIISISPQDTVFDVMSEWPSTVPVFIRHKMNCVGCSMAAFEALEDALTIYGLPVDPFIEELVFAAQQADDR